jgi:apolipoprotein N-acyltransferase
MKPALADSLALRGLTSSALRKNRSARAALFGGVLALGSPPFDLYPALWLGMAGLAACLSGPPEWPLFASPSRVALTGARRGFAFGVAANLVALRFIPAVVARFTPLPYAVGVVGLALLAAFEATRWMLAAVACETLVRARVPRAVAFAAGVYAGTFVPTMIPWTVAGGVSPWPQMVQLADVVGERGVTAIMALVAGLAAQAIVELTRGPGWRRAAGSGAAAVVIVGAQASLGAWRMREVERARQAAHHVRVGLVQPSVEATTRWEDGREPWILDRLAGLARAAESHGADLVVWPEGAYPYRLPHGSRRVLGPARIVQPGVRTPILTGLLMTGAPGGGAYNSAVVALPDGSLSESYDKRHLLWFGETVPLADRVPWLRQVFARGLGLAPGSRSEALVAGEVRAGVLICYEDTLSDAGREAAPANPNLLVNLTNDAWFSGSSESELHLRLSALRAVELRRDLVRSVNGGPTSWVDATGRVRGRGSPDFPGTLTSDPALLETRSTVFAQVGDTPWAIALLVLANVAVWRRARQGA